MTTGTTTGASAIQDVTSDARGLTVRFDDGVEGRFNRFWLRDNCPANGDRASLFHAFNAASMSDGLSILGAEACEGGLRVTFDDGMVDVFEVPFLREYVAAPDSGTSTDRAAPDVSEPLTVAFDPDLVDSAVHHALLGAVTHRGLGLVTGVPEVGGLEAIASWLGPIRETDFGRVFDIVAEPDPFTPSQSAAALDPHTDDPYRYTPAGVSVLHCASPCSGDGGATTIVDGFTIAETIAAEAPATFELLSTVAVRYVHRRAASVEQGAAVHLVAAAPIIAVDREGRVHGIRFHERSMAPLRLDPERTDEFYRALMVFSRHVNGGRFAYRRRLAGGEAVVYDNQRVLHGRTAITGGNARRHLRLCTVDRDQVHSRFRMLCERHAPGTEHGWLPAGSTS